MSNVMADKKKPMQLDPQKQEYVAKLEQEKEEVDSSTFPNAAKLLADEIDRVQTGKELNKLVELHHPKPLKLTVKVLIPVKQFPKFNFVGKLLGPKGNSLKRLQEETGAKMAILGRGSMKDSKKEEELRQEGGKFAHLNEELHCLVEVFGLPTEVHQRMSAALAELQRFLIPDNNDEIRQQQYEEMLYLNGENGGGMGAPGPAPRGRGRGRGAPPPPHGRGAPGGIGALLATPAARGQRGGFSGSSRGPSRGMPSGRAAPAGRAAPRAAPPGRAPPPSSRSVPPLGRTAPMSRPAPPGRPAPVSRPPAEASYDQDPYYSQSTASFTEDNFGYEEPQDFSTDTYNPSFPSAGAGETEFYDYGHGSSADDTYGDTWSQAGGSYGKAAARTDRSVGARSHPYGASSAPRQARY